MRNLAIRLVLLLCARFEISIIDETRRDMGNDAIDRARRWEAFSVERGGLYDLIERQRLEAFQAYADCRPDDTAEKEYLAQQDRCWRQIKARVDGVIQNGRIEAAKSQPQAVSISPIRKSA